MESTKINPPESHHANTHVNMAPRHGLVQHFKVGINASLTLGNQSSHAADMRKARGPDIGRSPEQLVDHSDSLANHMMKRG